MVIALKESKWVMPGVIEKLLIIFKRIIWRLLIFFGNRLAIVLLEL